MTDIPEVTEARKRLDAFVGNLRDRACLTCGECAYEGMAHSMDVATCFSGVYADIATLSDTIEKLTADNKTMDGVFAELNKTLRAANAQATHHAAVVEAAKRQADDPMVGCPFCGHTTQAGHDEDCVLLPALSAREEAGQ